MKKIILLLGFLMVAGSAAQAACEYQCVQPYDMNNKFFTFWSAVSGYNSIVENKAEAIIRDEILKTSSADVLNVDLESRSPGDLKNGIFKSFKLHGENVVMKDVHLDNIDINTLCDFNYVKQEGKNVRFVENLPMSFSFVINEDNLNKTMVHEAYTRKIAEFNNMSATYGLGFRVNSTRVAIKANKFYYIASVNIPFTNREQKIVLESDLNVKNGRIDLNNTRIVSSKVKLDVKRIDALMNYLNPLEHTFRIFNEYNAGIKVQNLAVKGNVIYTDGIVIIQK